MAVAYGGNNTSGPIEIATACNAHGGAGRMDFESVAIQERATCENPDAGPDGVGVRDDGTAYTLEARAVPQAVMTLAIRGREEGSTLEVREDGTANAVLTPSGGRGGIGVGAVAYGIDEEQNGSEELFGCLKAREKGGGFEGAVVIPDVADPISAHEAGTYTHEGKNNFHLHNVIPSQMAVRRLTPVECEKLQGVPPGFTLVPYRGKPIADGNRYRMLGNGFAIPVLAWVGRRIEEALETGKRTVL